MTNVLPFTPRSLEETKAREEAMRRHPAGKNRRPGAQSQAQSQTQSAKIILFPTQNNSPQP